MDRGRREKIAEEQAGFRADYAVTDPIFTGITIIKKVCYKMKGKRM